MKADLLDNWQDFYSLENEWNNLLKKSSANTIFLTWEWLYSWAEIVEQKVQPFVICVRDDSERLIGLAPYYFMDMRLMKLISYRTLRTMADFATGAEYPDWIVHKEHENSVYRLIAKKLNDLQQHWDCIWMPKLSGWTGAKKRLLSACEEQGFFFHIRPHVFSSVELPNDMPTYLKGLTKSRRQNLRTEGNKLVKRDGVKIVQCNEPGKITEFLNSLFDLHYQRWALKGEEGTFKRKPYEALFYEKFVPLALKNNWLWLYALKEQDSYKAMQIGYVYNNTFYALQEGFDPDYIKGAGNFLRSHVIEQCITAGIKDYDFLGTYSEHKKRWLAKKRFGYDLLVGHQGVKGRILFSKKIWPTGRYFCPVLKY